MTNRSTDGEPGQPASRAQPDAEQTRAHDPASTDQDRRRHGEQQHDRIRERYYEQGGHSSQSGYGNQSNPASRDDSGNASESSETVSQGTPPPDRWQPALDEAKIERGQQQSPDRQS